MRKILAVIALAALAAASFAQMGSQTGSFGSVGAGGGSGAGIVSALVPPNLTSVNAANGFVTSSSDAAGHASTNAWQGSGSTYWSPNGAGVSNWIEFTFSNVVVVTSYQVNLISGKTWLLQGSGDGVTFNNLDYQTNNQTTGGTFAVNNTAAYSTYRLLVREASIGVTNLQFFGVTNSGVSTATVNILATAAAQGVASTNVPAFASALTSAGLLQVNNFQAPFSSVRFDTNNLALWISLNGSDLNSGTNAANPLKTLFQARTLGSNFWITDNTLLTNISGGQGFKLTNITVYAQGTTFSNINSAGLASTTMKGFAPFGTYTQYGGTNFGITTNALCYTIETSKCTNLFLYGITFNVSSDGIFDAGGVLTNLVMVGCTSYSTWDNVNFGTTGGNSFAFITNCTFISTAVPLSAGWNTGSVGYSGQANGYFTSSGTSYLVNTSLTAANGTNNTYGVYATSGAVVYLYNCPISVSSTVGGNVAAIHADGAGTIIHVPWGYYQTNLLQAVNGAQILYDIYP